MIELDDEIVNCVRLKKRAPYLLATGYQDGTLQIKSVIDSVQQATIYESKDHFFPVNDI